MVKPVKISVIIPTHNAVAYLTECLTSIQQQVLATPNTTFDILIGIDAHQETVIFLKKLLPNLYNTRVFLFNEHQGPYIIRNTLATITDADYLVFFDSDDVMPKGFINSLIKPFENHNLIRFGFKNFIDLPNRNGESERIFDKKKIARFEKDVVRKQIITLEGRPSFTKRLNALRTSKYLNINRYGKFLSAFFKRPKSGVVAIKRPAFMKLNGFKPWPVEADLELIERAQLHKMSYTTLPKTSDFFRRIHYNNLTSNYNMGMQSKIRKYYQEQKRKSIFEEIDIVITNSYTEFI